MLGLSPHETRTQLLHRLATGVEKDIGPFAQANFDKGHEAEANAISLAEALLGEELYPVTCSEGVYSCSCDGLTMDGTVAWEHKLWNAKTIESMAVGALPAMYMPQDQQILMVTGAEKCLFMCSDGTKDNCRYLYVFPDLDWFGQIKRGWEQFKIDLEAYTPTETPDKPKAEAIMKLPALNVQIKGEIIATNLPLFTELANDYLDKINLALVTDQDFANAEAQAKECRDIAKTLEVSKKAALSQTASIDELLRTVDYYQGKFNQVGLKLEKLVKTEKEGIKAKIAGAAMDLYNAHVRSLQGEIVDVQLAVTRPDFAEAMKGKRTLASLQDSVDTELANAKINADAVARDIRLKLSFYKEKAGGHGAIFRDLQQIIYKPMDDFRLLVETRIAEFERVQSDRIAEQLAGLPMAEEGPPPEIVTELAESKLENIPGFDGSKKDGTPTNGHKTRPSDIELIGAVMAHFKVAHQVAQQWLYDFGK